ncbi:MAG: tetratricopeptide repeat protein [Magnetococcales bacterium]|nr:tetratricopeptide repeat protein [Magnetococcales bacterium]
MAESQWVVNVEGATFEREVLERSGAVPVLVDFWATWCGPCRTLGPLLTKLANQMDGRFVLAKIDSDRNPDLARRYNVRGIPAVKLFVDGEVVDEFTGALPESRIVAFLDHALPSGADKLARQARALLERSDFPQAERLCEEALSLEPTHAAALLGLTRICLATDRMEQANAAFSRLKPRDRESAEARLVAAKLVFSSSVVDLGPLEESVAARPDDLSARMALGEALVAAERYEEGLIQFLEVVRRDRRFGDDAGRKAVIRVFDLLGPGHPLIATFRPRLSALLFA